jgi:hypothetical protein
MVDGSCEGAAGQKAAALLRQVARRAVLTPDPGSAERSKRFAGEAAPVQPLVAEAPPVQERPLAQGPVPMEQPDCAMPVADSPRGTYERPVARVSASAWRSAILSSPTSARSTGPRYTRRPRRRLLRWAQTRWRRITRLAQHLHRVPAPSSLTESVKASTL